MIDLTDVSKTFTLHNQGGAVIEVLSGVTLAVAPGECVALTGASGAGKSTLMRMIYGNYRARSGIIRVGGTDLVRAEPREIIRLRREVLGYVSQFLRVVPRVPTQDVVAEPLRAVGVAEAEAGERAAALLERLNIPRPLWSLSPTTFSGGEQQRVAVARALIHQPTLVLADEPTGNLDAETGRHVLALLLDLARASEQTLVMVTHSREVAASADRVLRMADGRLQAVAQDARGGAW
ncbi:MAG TPA: phosphonate C-P lyase system protein PhnL [Gammaproteobacteria bacterium]|nr:phosphonate C-P lyase system protein PhnL [Gammaproteobacteria bacterium]